MFLKIDDWLFDKVFQPISDWSTDHYGRGPFWLAANLYYLLSVSFVVSYFFIEPSVIFVVIPILLAYLGWNNDRKDELKNNSNALRLNRERVSIFCLANRVGVLFFSVITAVKLIMSEASTIKIVILLQLLLYTTCLYFEACETKPPAPPKKKESSRLAEART